MPFWLRLETKQPRGEEAALLAAMASADAAARDAWVADHVSGEERRRFVCELFTDKAPPLLTADVGCDPCDPRVPGCGICGGHDSQKGCLFPARLL